MSRSLYRIVVTNPPTTEDFKSHRAKGRPLRHPSPETIRLLDGLSVFDSEASARANAHRYPRLGSYIAEVRIPDDGGFRYERSGTTEGHYTLWGDPAELLARVVRVVSV